MKLIVGMLALVLLSGCVSVEMGRGLSREQVSVAVEQIDNKLAEKISELDDNIRQGRKALQAFYMMGSIDSDAANKVQREFMVADYFMAKAWTSMVEGSVEDSVGYLKIGNSAFESGVNRAIKASEAEQVRSGEKISL